MYDSISESTKCSFELIIVSPHLLPEELKNKENIIWFQDWGSPVRCQQIAASMTTGKYITWCADDGYFNKDILDEIIDYLEWKNDKKSIVVANYTEDNNLVEEKVLKIINAYPKVKYLDPEFWIFNVAIMLNKYFKELGRL